MSTKEIKTRISLKYDSYSNWTQKGTWSDGVFTPDATVNTTYWEGFKPLPGEVVFFSIPQETGDVSQVPAILFKVGDGTNFLSALPWGSAIAADVYAWAKQQSLLGGTKTGEVWSFENTNDTPDVIKDTREEVAAFVKANTVNIRVRIIDLGNNEFQLQTTTSTTDDGWVNAGDPFSFTQVTYTAGAGLSLDTVTNEFSIKLNDDNLVLGEEGLSTKVAEVTYTTASTTGETPTPANLTATAGLLDENAVGAIKDYVDAKAAEATDASDVTLSSQTSSESGILSTYVLSQGGEEVGRINIPKDFLVKSATLVEATADNPIEEQTSGKYIKFEINSKDSTSESGDVLYLNVTELCEVYTVNNQTGYVTLAIDDNNNITATAQIQPISTATEDLNGLATALDVKTFVGEQLAANVPNVRGQEAIKVADGENSKTVSLKLNDVEAADGATGHVSGLKQSEDGLEINDEIEWILNCGGAPTTNNSNDNQEQQ